MVRWASAGPAGAHTGIPGGTEGEGGEAMPGSAGWDVHPTLADGWAQVYYRLSGDLRTTVGAGVKTS